MNHGHPQQNAPTPRESAILTIAREALGVEALETRRSDGLDFHDLAVWSIKEALERAYEAGRCAGPPTRAVCPACSRELTIHPITTT